MHVTRFWSTSKPLTLTMYPFSVFTLLALLFTKGVWSAATNATVGFYSSKNCGGSENLTSVAPDTCINHTSSNVGVKISENARCENGTSALFAIYGLRGCNDSLVRGGPINGGPNPLPPQAIDFCIFNQYGSFAFYCNGSDEVTAQGNPPIPSGGITIYDDEQCGASNLTFVMPTVLVIDQCYENISGSVQGREAARCPGDKAGQNATSNLYFYTEVGCKESSLSSYVRPSFWTTGAGCWNTTGLKSVKYACEGVRGRASVWIVFLAASSAAILIGS